MMPLRRTPWPPGRVWIAGLLLAVWGLMGARPCEALSSTKTFTANAAVSSGDTDGWEGTVTNAAGTASDDSYATDTNSGTASNSGCTDAGTDRHRLYTFGYAIPTGATIDGIVVNAEVGVDSTNNTPAIGVQISADNTTYYNAGGSATAGTPQNVTDVSAPYDQALSFGGTTDTWGKGGGWTVGEINGANFSVRTCNTDQTGAGSTRDFSLDYLSVTVHYTIPTITVGGTVYSGEGSGPLTSKTVVIKVDGAGSYTDDTDGSGVYSIAGITADSGAVITAFLDGETEQAVTVTRSAIATISDLDLYQNRIIVRHEDSGPITFTNLSVFDNDTDNDGSAGEAGEDTDVIFNVNGSGTLIITGTKELHVWTGKTLTAGGSTLLGVADNGGDLHVQGTLNLVQNSMYIYGGDITGAGIIYCGNGNNTCSSGTVYLDGAGDIDGGTFTFYNLTIGNGSGTTTTTLQAGTYTVKSLLTVATNQTFSAGANSITVDGANAQLTVNGIYTQSSGGTTSVLNGSPAIIDGSGPITIYNLTTSNVQFQHSNTLTIDGDWTFTSGSIFLNDTSFTVKGNMSGAGALVYCDDNGGDNCAGGTVTADGNITAATATFYNLIAGDGTGTATSTWSVNTGVVKNALTVSANQTLALGTNTLAVGTGASNGHIVGAGAITQTSGTVTLQGAGNLGGTSAAAAGTCAGTNGDFQFYNLTVGDNANAKTTSLCGSITVSNDFTIAGGTAAQTFDANTKTVTLTGTDGSPFTINGTFTADAGTILFSGNNAGGNTSVPATTYYNVTFNTLGAGETFAAAGTLVMNNGIVVSSGDTLAMGANTLTVGTGGSNGFIVGAGAISQSASTTTTIKGTGNFGGTSAAVPGTCSGTNGSFQFYNVTSGSGSNADTTTVCGNISVSNALTTATSHTLALGSGNTITVGTGASNGHIVGAGAITQTSGTVTLQGAGNLGGTSAAAAGTCAGTNGSFQFYNLTAGDASNTKTTSACGDITVSNDLTIAASQTFDANTYTVTLSGTDGTPFTVNGTLTEDLGTFAYTGNYGSGNTTVTAETYNDVTFNNASETYAAGGTIAVGDDVTVTAGIFTMGTQNMSVGGDISVANGASFTATWIGGGTLTLTGGTASVNVGGAGGMTSTITTIAVGKTVTMAGNWTVQSTLTRNGNLDLGSYRLTHFRDGVTLAGSGTVTAGTGSTYNPCLWNANTTTIEALTFYHLSPSKCFTAGTDRQFSIQNGTVINGNLSVDGARANLAGTVTVAGNLNVGTTTATSQMDLGSASVSVGGNISVYGGATLTPGTSTVTLNGTADQSITSTTESFNHLVINNTGTAGSDDITLGDALDIDGDFTITNGDFTPGANAVTLAGSLSIGVSGSVDNTSFTGLTFDGTTAETWTDSTSGQDLGAVAMNKTDAGSPSTNNKVTLGSSAKATSVTIDGTSGSEDTLDLGSSGYTLTLTGSGTPLTRSGTFTAGTSTVTYTSGSGVAALSSAAMTGSNAFNNLTINGSGTFTAGVALAVGKTLTISGGTLALGTNDLTVGTGASNGHIVGAGAITQAASGTTTIQGAGNLGGTSDASAGTCSGTSGSYQFYNLTAGDNANVKTTTLCGDITVSNVLTIAGGTATQTLDAKDKTITLAGSGTPLVKSGTFTRGTSTIAYTSGSGVTALADSAPGFYNLTINGTGTFTAGIIVSATNVVTVSGGTLAMGNNNLFVGTLDGSGHIVGAGAISQSNGGTTLRGTGNLGGTSSAVAGTCSGTNGSFQFGSLQSSSDTIPVTTTLCGNITVSNQLSMGGNRTFAVGGNTVTAADVTLNSTGTWSMISSGGRLEISGSNTLLIQGGTFTTADVATAPVLTSNDRDGSPTYIDVNLTSGTLNVAELSVDYLNSSGFRIGSGVTVTRFDNVTWGGNGQTGGTDVILDITGQTVPLLNHAFPASWSGGDCNVQSNTSGVVTMWDWTGGFGGENNDCDTSGGEVVWKGGIGGPANSAAGNAPAIY